MIKIENFINNINNTIYIIKMEVDGIILILSCQKHKETRIKDFKLDKNEYNNWKVIYVIGDFFLKKEYEIRDDNFLYIKCEDSYIHLLKKLALAIKYVNQMFTIKQGILRCGDDLMFNVDKLIEFTNSEKYDFYGTSYNNTNYSCTDINELKKTKLDSFMYNYYLNRIEDLTNPQHNLSNVNILQYLERPDVYGPIGIMYYLSNKCCNILINHMENINYNIFHYDTFTNSYPYTIEDSAIAFIMYFNQIPFISKHIFFNTDIAIAQHTNRYK